MTKYDFDTIISRSGSGDVMHEQLQSVFGRSDLLPMWVADMDFPVCPDIIDAISLRLQHPILGYTVIPEDYFSSIHDWVLSHQNWNVQRNWMCYIPGIVKGIGFVVNVFLKPDEKVIVMPPVYHPFFLTPRANGREVLWSPLKHLDDGSYDMDFEALERVCDDKCRLLILCNPHNPCGISWPKETLQRLADFCYEHRLLVISDEIHCDMQLFGHHHTPFASVSERAASISITFQAPTKTFNIAGIVSSFAVIPNSDIRKKFFGWLRANELDSPNMFAPIATIAAYRHGEEWRRQMLSYVEGNIKWVEQFCREHLPQVKPLRPEASFLIWLDCQGLELNHEELVNLFVNKAHLALNDGEMFGPGGEGHMRLNVGMPRALVQEGMMRLASACLD